MSKAHEQAAIMPLLVKPKWYQTVKEGGTNLGSKEKADPHKHTWKKYKQTIRPDNPNFKRHDADIYMIVSMCQGCKTKNYVNLYVK